MKSIGPKTGVGYQPQPRPPTRRCVPPVIAVSHRTWTLKTDDGSVCPGRVRTCGSCRKRNSLVGDFGPMVRTSDREVEHPAPVVFPFSSSALIPWTSCCCAAAMAAASNHWCAQGGRAVVDTISKSTRSSKDILS